MNQTEQMRTLRPPRASTAQNPEPITVTVGGAARMTGLGLTTIYALMGEGRLRSVRIGGRRLVFTESIREMLDTGVQL